MLSKSGFIEGVQGKGGGYRLKRAPEEYTVGEILRVVEGNFAPVSCLECGAKPCERVNKCRTISMWRNLQKTVNEYFDGITLNDLMRDSGGIL